VAFVLLTVVAVEAYASCPAAPLAPIPPAIGVSIEPPSSPESTIFKVTVTHNDLDSFQYTWRGVTTPEALHLSSDPIEFLINGNCMLGTETLVVRGIKCRGRGMPDDVNQTAVAPPDHQPSVEFAGYALSGQVQVHVRFPHTFVTNRHMIATLYPSNGGAPRVWDSAGTSLGHDEVLVVPLSVVPGTMIIEVRSCEELKARTSVPLIPGDCGECPTSAGSAAQCDRKECVGDPVNTFSRNLRYRDSDPIVASDVLPMRRTLHSTTQIQGFFGSHWISMFDATLRLYDESADVRYANLVTENGHQ
jgi:hypothetical protein